MPAPSESGGFETAKHITVAESAPGVEAIVDGSEPGRQHMRVNLRRRQIGVAEHQLNRAQVGAPLEQVGRKRMAEDVWADRARQVRPPRVPLENLPEADAAERTAARVEEQDRKSTRLNSSHEWISYAVFCLKKKKHT